MLPIFLAILSLTPAPTGIVMERIEVIEHNSIAEPPSVDWDADHSKPVIGRVILAQWILWEASSDENVPSPVVRAWKLARPEQHVTRTPGGEYLLTLEDGPTLRQIVAPVYHATMTTFDPEVANRSVWPLEKRRLLSCQSGRRSAEAHNLGLPGSTPGTDTSRILLPEPAR